MAMAIRRAALHISSVAMLIRRAALHISSVAMLIRESSYCTQAVLQCLFAELSLHTSSVAKLQFAERLCIYSSVKMAYLQSIRRDFNLFRETEQDNILGGGHFA